MPNKRTSTWRSVDWFTIILYVIMITAGWISICGASFNLDNPDLFDSSGRPGMQLIWIGTSVVLIFMIMMLDKNFFETLAFPIYGLIVLLLIVTIFIAPDIKGSRSWLVITSTIRLQPAEFAKFATALALARFMNNYEFNLLKARSFVLSALIVIIPMLCIIMQKDTGSALVFLAFALVFYREGMSGFILFLGFCSILFFVIGIRYGDIIWRETSLGQMAVLLLIIPCVCFIMYEYVKGSRQYIKYILIGSSVLFGLALLVSSFFLYDLCLIALVIIAMIVLTLLLLFIKLRDKYYLYIAGFALYCVAFLYSTDYVFDEVLKQYQRTRIEVALGMIDDPAGAGYNVNQSKIAIGSGGLLGKGYLNGTQTKLKYVPEQDTDFIFCTVGEENGFVGAVFTLLLFLILIIRIIFLAERQRDTFRRIYGYCVASIIFSHLAINIGMVIGITPVIGIPLPFFSYGGSSLLAFTILLFIFLRLDASRNERL